MCYSIAIRQIKMVHQLTDFHHSSLHTSKLPKWLWYKRLDLLVTFNNKTKSWKLTTAIANELISEN